MQNEKELIRLRRFMPAARTTRAPVGDIQAAQADFLEAQEVLETIESAEKKYLLRALVAWKRSLKRAAQHKSAARSLAASTTATADAAEDRKDRSCGGTSSRLIVFVFVPACSPSIAPCP